MAESAAKFICNVFGISDELTLIIFKMIEMARNLFACKCLDHSPDFFAVDFGIDRGSEIAKGLAFLPTERSPTTGLDKLHPHFVIEGGVALIESFGFVPFPYQSFAFLIPPGFGGWSGKSRSLGNIFLC